MSAAVAKLFPLASALLDADTRVAWRPFSKEDWYGFAGATSFPDGSPPLFAELTVDGQEGLAVLDAVGIEVYVYVDTSNWHVDETTWAAHGPATARIAALLSRSTSTDELLALGLEVVS